MDEETTSPSAPSTAPPPRAPRRAWRWAAAALALLLLVAIAAVAAVLWAVRSPAGSAWLVRQVPNLVVAAPRGTLVGDFAADRIEIAIPGSGTLRLDRPRWQGLAAARGDAGRWLHLRIDALHAERATWLAASQPASSAPARPPASLRLPLEIEIGAATLGELRFGDDDKTPLRARMWGSETRHVARAGRFARLS